MNERAISEWVTRACAVVDGVTPDYIAVHVRAAAKSWPEHASVRVEDRSPAAVVEEVVGHVRDIAESSGAEGRNGWAVRLKLYRAKSPAGSKTFSSGAPAGSDPETGDDDAERSPKSEMVATIRELRMLAVHTVGELASQSTHGWQLASKLAEQNAQLTVANAQLQAQVQVGAAAQAPDPMLQAAFEAIAPQIPNIVQGLAVAAAMRAAAAATPSPGDG